MREPSSPQRSNAPLPSPPTTLRKHGLNPCKPQGRQHGLGDVGGWWDWGSPEEAPGTPVPFLCCTTHSTPPPLLHTHTGAVQRV